MDDRDELKRAIRERMRAARRDLTSAEVRGLASRAADRVMALPEVRQARLVLCYVSIRTELPTRPLLDALIAAGKPVAVPRVEGSDLRAHLAEHLHEMPVGAYGIPTSDGPDVTDDVDLCVTPGLAFTAEGCRLGYGGGYYDRFLDAHRRVVPVGLCYDVQLVEHVPMHPHDRHMAIVVTPSRVLRAGAEP